VMPICWSKDKKKNALYLGGGAHLGKKEGGPRGARALEGATGTESSSENLQGLHSNPSRKREEGKKESNIKEAGVQLVIKKRT